MRETTIPNIQRRRGRLVHLPARDSPDRPKCGSPLRGPLVRTDAPASCALCLGKPYFGEFRPRDLAPVQQRVLALVWAERTNKEIARELCLALQTVKGHITAILRRLGVSSRVGAALAWERAQADAA